MVGEDISQQRFFLDFVTVLHRFALEYPKIVHKYSASLYLVPTVFNLTPSLWFWMVLLWLQEWLWPPYPYPLLKYSSTSHSVVWLFVECIVPRNAFSDSSGISLVIESIAFLDLHWDLKYPFFLHLWHTETFAGQFCLGWEGVFPHLVQCSCLLSVGLLSFNNFLLWIYVRNVLPAVSRPLLIVVS